MKFDNYINLILESINDNESYAVLPGGFKPPHKGHFDALKYLLDSVDKGIVYIGKNIRDGITAEQSKAIWDIYVKYLPKPVDVIITPVSPVKSTYEFVDLHKDNDVIVGVGPEEDPTELKRYDFFRKHADTFPLVKIVSIPSMHGRISGTEIRSRIIKKDPSVISLFVPNGVSTSDQAAIAKILGI